LYLDGKNRAVLSLHPRLRFAAPGRGVTAFWPRWRGVLGLCLDASSSNAYEIIPPGRYQQARHKYSVAISKYISAVCYLKLLTILNLYKPNDYECK